MGEDYTRRNLMKRGLFCILIAAMTLSGCGSMLPSSKLTAKSPWDSFGEAKSAFDKITPYETNTKEMQALGFEIGRAHV